MIKINSNLCLANLCTTSALVVESRGNCSAFPTAQTRSARNYGAVANLLVWRQSQARKRVVYFITVFIVCGFFSKLLVSQVSFIEQIIPMVLLNTPFFADLVLSLLNLVYKSTRLLEERNKLVLEKSNYVEGDSPPAFLLVILFTQVNSCVIIMMLAVPPCSSHYCGNIIFKC